MRKYQQLLLLIFSFISLILLLVYRHEYNRLHYVLEVFNFFGTPCNISGLLTNNTYLNHYDWGLSPVWQESEDYYVFSGFGNETLTQTIVVHKKISKVPKKCYLWFESDKTMLGEMSAREIIDIDDFKAYVYNCRLRYSKIVPYAVSFGSKSKYFELNKIIISQIGEKSATTNAAICVLPSVYNKRQIIEFISFHKLIGFKNFIFYYNDLPSNLLKFLTNLSELVDIEFTFFPWNSPFHLKNLSRIIIERDCLLRTVGRSKTSVVLGLNEFLIPVDSYSMFPLFEKQFFSFDHINVPVQSMCIQSNDTFRPIIVQNTKSFEDGNMETVKFHTHSVASNKTEKNSEQSFHLVVNAYKGCAGYNGPFNENKLMNRYTTDLMRSTLIRLLHDGQI